MANKTEKTPEQIALEEAEKAAKQKAKEEEKAARQKAKEDEAAKKASGSQSDAALEQITKNTAASLHEDEQVRVIVTPKHDKDRFWTGAINGHWYKIAKGELVSVPKPLALLMRETEKVIEETEALKGDKSLSGVFTF